MFISKIRQLRIWSVSFFDHPKSVYALAVLSFCESIFFFIPADILLIAMVMTRKQKAWYYTFVCIFASVAGAIVGYIIGYAVFDIIAMPMIDFYDKMEDFNQFLVFYDRWGISILLVSAITFIPFKIAVIASGFVLMHPVIFVLVCLVGRTIRFAGVTSVILFDIRPWLLDIYRRSLLVWLCSGFVILMVLGLEYISVLSPCPLCLYQRVAYYIALILCPFVVLGARYGYIIYAGRLLGFVGIVFCFNIGLALFHSGVEWGFWSILSFCMDQNNTMIGSIEALHNALQEKIVMRCDEVPWRLFGLSLAFYNAIASCMIAFIIAWPLFDRFFFNTMASYEKGKNT